MSSQPTTITFTDFDNHLLPPPSLFPCFAGGDQIWFTCGSLLNHGGRKGNSVGCRVGGSLGDGDICGMSFGEIAKHLSLPPVKLHCSMLAEDAIKAAVKDYETKRGKPVVTEKAADA
ncbi:iron-sulfur cluster assembly protein 1-like protein [Tanacetum coccineum]